MKLSRQERRALYAGEFPKIKGEGDAPTFVGESIKLSPRFYLTVTDIRETAKGGWSLEYAIRDDRDLFLGGSPVVDEASRQTRSWGVEEKGYTSNPHSPLAEAGSCVTPEVQEEQTKQANRKWALYEGSEKLVETINQQQKAAWNKLRRLMDEGAKLGVDITPHIAAALKAAEDEIAAARTVGLSE